MKYLIALGCVAALGLAGQGAGAQDIRTERVHFPGGQNGTTITGKITGYASVSYIVGAEAGQTLTVALNPSNGATYFNVYGPGKAPGDEALANAQLTGPMVPDLNRFSGKLPASGEYTISVYMMRSAARRDESSDYTLDIAIAGSDAAALDEPVRNDYADGLAGGPDYWEVNIGEVSGQLNLRAAPSQSAAILKSVADGTILRNQGCRMAEGRRWCRVETLDNAAVSGWVAGDFLSEGSYTEAPAAASAAKREPTTKTERVQFPRGATQTQLKGRLSGGDAVNYVLGAREGQSLTVSLLPQNADTHFNIFVPGGELLYESARGGQDQNQYRGQLLTTGDHTVTVYYLGAAETAADYAINFVIE